MNVGAGRPYTVRAIAERLAAVLGRPQIEPEITHAHRVGDIRHCFPDLTRARALLGYEPEVSLEQGLGELAEWLEREIAIDRVSQARAELAMRGLTL